MVAPRWRKVLRDLAGHKFRSLLVVLSISVGIFAIIVVLGARGVLLREFEAVFEDSNPPTATIWVMNADDDVVDAVDRVAGVRAAEGRRVTSLRFVIGSAPKEGAPANWSTIQLQAVPDFENQQTGRFKVLQDRSLPPPRGEVLLEQSVLTMHDLSAGDIVTVETREGKHVPLRVAGFAHDINAFPAHFVGYSTGFISMETLALIDEPDRYNMISVLAEDREITRSEAGTLVTAVREDVLDSRGIRVLHFDVPEPGSHFLGDIFRAISLLLLALGALSMLLSGFLVVTTIQAFMSQQVRQVGIMKAIGGSTSQINSMYIGMVLAYGILAVALGLPTGILAAQWFAGFGAELLNFRITTYEPPLYVIVIGVVMGIGSPLLSAIVPIRAGTKMPVARALVATGLSRTVFGHGLIDRLLGLLRGLPRPIALSLRNTFLRKGRLALTLTTLTLAAAVLMSVLTVRSSILQTVDTLSVWRFDARLTLSGFEPKERVLDIAERGTGVTLAEGMLETSAILQRSDGTEGDAVSFVGLAPESPFVAPRMEQGRWLEPDDTHAIVVNTDALEAEPELSVGRSVELEIAGITQEWRVAGVVSTGMMGAVVFAPMEQLDAMLNDRDLVNRVFTNTIFGHQSAQKQAVSDLLRHYEDAGIQVLSTQTQVEERDTLAEQLGILVTFLAIMGGLLAAVGVIGLAGTMTINVLESQRQIGVMRAVGASHRSIYSIFITESVVIALLAWAIGAVISWPMSLALVRMLSGAMDLPLVYAFSWQGVVWCLLAVLVVAVAASLLPAYRASQVSVRDAIAYE
ncbi:MAG: ABC transporter permease [Actinobacteria bacterium]|nr:ABC transporter permease [Actinomycetota bacterium]